MHQAESGKLAARHNPVEIAEACRKEAGAYSQAATLDTEPLAKSYSDGESHPLVFISIPVRTCNLWLHLLSF